MFPRDFNRKVKRECTSRSFIIKAEGKERFQEKSTEKVRSEEKVEISMER